MTASPLALIVDDEPDILELIELTLEPMGIACRKASSFTEACEWLQQHTFNLCLTDMRLPEEDGIQLVKLIGRHHPATPVAVITAHGSMETAVEALKAGAFDFISKPVKIEILRNLVNTALEAPLTYPHKDRRLRHRLLGESAPMRAVRSKIAKLAHSQAPVYISGESGTGKERVARLIHEQGSRAAGPFVPVNCGAIPYELMESEFFGHKKGSFTGAGSDKAGLFQAATGGTLLLDEVADLPLSMQVKLLRTLQEKAVRPIGSQQEIPVDVRILCATHRNLAEWVKEGRFRQDLFYRLNVIELSVPALRERTEDIPLLVEHFLNKLAASSQIPCPQLTAAAMQSLQAYPFPGNVRELENILERALILCESETIDKKDLDFPAVKATGTPPSMNGGSLEEHLEDVERETILQVLEQTRYNKTAAAKILGITFRALRYRLKKLELESAAGFFPRRSS